MPHAFLSLAASVSRRMKITKFSLATALVPAWSTILISARPSSAWIVSPTHHVGSSRAQLKLSFSSSLRSFSSALHSTIAPPEQQDRASDEAVAGARKDRTIAEGTVVSRSPGGFTAVRLIDDDAGGDQRARSVVAGAGAPAAASKGFSSADLQGKRVVFPDGTQGCVVAHRPPVVFVYSDTAAAGDRQAEGLVKVTSDMATVQVSPSQTDVKLNFNEAGGTSPDVDDGFKLMKRAIFAPIAKISDIALINNPMLTGVTMIDALSPIGQGQNMLFIGHNIEDMRQYTMDFLKTQVRDGKRTKCVYASTTQDRSTVRRQLKASGLGNEIHVVAPEDSDVVTDDSSKAARAVALSWAACSVGEMYALEEGLNALVVVDTIDLHKQLWDLTTRVLVDVYGVDSVVKGDREGSASSEMRAFYSSLIQRSSQYKASRGGGSVTLLLLTQIPRSTVDDDQVFDPSAFDEAPDKVKERIKLLAQRNIPLTAETLRKVDIPIPTEGVRRMVLQHVDDLMSMSDGQIWFDEKREAAGQVPPVDPQRSVTRIGIGADTASRADAPALRRIAERLRLELSQASSMEGADDTEATKRQIQRREALLLAMYQPSGSGGRRLSESCVALLAAQEGHLDAAVRSGLISGTKEGEAVVQGLLDHVLRNAAAAMADIDSSLDLSTGTRDELTRAVRSYFEV